MFRNEFESILMLVMTRQGKTLVIFAKYDDIFVILENVPHVTDRQKRI